MCLAVVCGVVMGVRVMGLDLMVTHLFTEPLVNVLVLCVMRGLVVGSHVMDRFFVRGFGVSSLVRSGLMARS